MNLTHPLQKQNGPHNGGVCVWSAYHAMLIMVAVRVSVLVLVTRLFVAHTSDVNGKLRHIAMIVEYNF